MDPAASASASPTDTDIFALARKTLDDDPSIPATVRVHVDDGTAWLTGTVRLTSERAAAGDVVRRIPGVRRVINKLVVTHTASMEGLESSDPST